MDGQEPPKLKEIFRRDFLTYLQFSRNMMIDDPDNRDEYPFLGYKIRRTDSENNIWDIIWEPENKDKPVLINSIDPSQFETAQSLANELARIAGVDFEDNEPEVDHHAPESPAFK